MVLSETGSKFFITHEAWHDYCEENKIADPWVLIRECESKINKHWKEIDKNGHTIWHMEIYSKDEWPEDLREEYNKLVKYRDQYMCDREVWEGEYMLKNFGYDLLTKFAQTHSRGETASQQDRAFYEWYEQVHPCEGADKQCNFACPVFNNCPYRDQGVYRNNVNYDALWENH